MDVSQAGCDACQPAGSETAAFAACSSPYPPSPSDPIDASPCSSHHGPCQSPLSAVSLILLTRRSVSSLAHTSNRNPEWPSVTAVYSSPPISSAAACSSVRGLVAASRPREASMSRSCDCPHHSGTSPCPRSDSSTSASSANGLPLTLLNTASGSARRTTTVRCGRFFDFFALRPRDTGTDRA